MLIKNWVIYLLTFVFTVGCKNDEDCKDKEEGKINCHEGGTAKAKCGMYIYSNSRMTKLIIKEKLCHCYYKWKSAKYPESVAK